MATALRRIVWKLLREALLVSLVLVTLEEASAQSGQQTTDEGGISHDLDSATTQRVSIGEDGAVASGETAPQPEPLGDVPEAQLSSEELAGLSRAQASYPAYEARDLKKDVNEAYIPQSVIGADQREPEPNTRKWPGSAVVQISFRAGPDSGLAMCSGAMIAPNVVLTAGHCVYTPGSSAAHGMWHRDFTIYPGRSKERTPFGRCRAKRLYSVTAWVNSIRHSEGGKLHDIGAIALDCAIGRRTGWFTMTSAEPDIGAATVIRGYPQETGKYAVGTQVKSPDQIRRRMDLKVFYQNDTFGGMSGSPVFRTSECPFGEVRNDQCRTIFAVHTNGVHCCGVWAENNAGTRLTDSRIKNILGWTVRNRAP